MIARPEALALVRERIPNANLVNHCIATELIMRALAEHEGLSADDVDRWGLAGLLHQRRIPEYEVLPPVGRTVILYYVERQPYQSLDMLSGIGYGG